MEDKIKSLLEVGARCNPLECRPNQSLRPQNFSFRICDHLALSSLKVGDKSWNHHMGGLAEITMVRPNPPPCSSMLKIINTPHGCLHLLHQAQVCTSSSTWSSLSLSQVRALVHVFALIKIQKPQKYFSCLFEDGLWRASNPTRTTNPEWLTANLLC